MCSFSTWGLWGKELLDCFPLNFHSIPVYSFFFPDVVIYILHRAPSHLFDSIVKKTQTNKNPKQKTKPQQTQPDLKLKHAIWSGSVVAFELLQTYFWDVKNLNKCWVLGEWGA